MKKIIVIVIILAVLTAGYFIFKKNPAEALDALDRETFSVTTEKAQKRDIQKDVLLSGTIKALEEAVLYPRAEGKLQKNLLKEGDSVKRGQSVALIERDEVGASYEPMVVPSTISGLVGNMYLDPGEHVTKNTPVAFIVNQESVRIIVDIPERYALQVKKGQGAVFSVESLPGKTFNATVNIISPVIDSTSRTVYVELLSDNKDAVLKSGMFANVTLVLEERKDALSVSAQNIFTDEKGAYVLENKDNIAARKDITAGFSNNKYTEITAGLEDGEEILQAAYGLKDGSKIRVN